MAVKAPTSAKSMLMDKRALQRAVAALNAQMGFVKDPTATAEKAQALMPAQGVRPEDNIASTEIVRMREEKFEREE